MTNFSPSFALKSFLTFVVLAILVGGCGKGDGGKEIAAARAAYELADLNKADKLATKGLALRPKDVDALVLSARIKLDLGEIPAARKIADRAAALSSDSDVRILSAQLSYHAKDFSAASACYRSLAGDAGLPQAVRSQAYAELGVVEMTGNEYQLARVSLLQALRLNPRNAAAWYHLGLLYRDGFGYEEAALEQFGAYVNQSRVASPRVQKVQRTLIPALKESIARKAAERPGAASRNSAASAAAISQAEALVKKGNLKAARQHFEKALETDVLSYPAALGLAQLWAKDPSAQGKKMTLEYYRRACSLKPGALRTYLTTGDVALRQGQNVTAVEIYSRAIAAAPTNIQAIDGFIKALRKVGGQGKIATAYQLYRDSLGALKR